MRKMIGTTAFAALLAAQTLAAQAPTLSPNVRQYVAVDAPTVALRNVKLVDGTGTPARDAQTIVIGNGKIVAVGPTASVRVPAGALVLDLAGHTVMPGIIGLHNHMYYNSRPQLQSYPLLFLGTGITTIRTTGSYDSYQELNLKRNIDAGRIPGPTIFVTGPYLQGPGPGPSAMHPLSGPEDARRMVRYWADEGVTWFKAYTQISRAELGAAIEEAHKHGIKVTAHLCSVGFREAVGLGIDNLEHGLLTNTEYWKDKRPDQCPQVGDSAVYYNLDLESPEVQQTFRDMVKNNVALTSTLAVYEMSTPSRVPFDQRVLDALYPDSREVVARWYENAKTRGDRDRAGIEVFKKHLAYERAFVEAGGLLAAGSDPCCTTSIAGFADQRNFELLVEAGFRPEEAVKVMTANGAKVLGILDRVGTIERGKDADLIVLRGDITRQPGDIRNTVTVFRHGVGYDSKKLIDAIKGRIGII